jgi:hypothetical protein
MASTISSGTATAVIDTPADLATSTTAGVFVAQWNLTNLAKGDVIRLYVKTKVLTGDTAEIIYEGTYANDLLSDCIIASPPIVSMFSVTMSIEQTDGTGRSIPWALIRIDA